MSKPIRAFVIIAAVTALAAVYFLRPRNAAAKWLTAPVTRGPIIRSVIATGTVNPVTVVQVGSYVSGPIQSIYADFNSPVKAGQLIAKIDPRPFAAQVALAHAVVANAHAQLAKDEANLAYQKVTFERDRALRAQAVVSQDQLDSQRNVYNQAVAQIALDNALIEQQQASLKAAELNLNYTNIISPVNGTVVSRNVDVGQTVAASFQTPTLFLIARDLTKMQVDTNVSESDIGNVKSGQQAEFKVDAFPDRVFEGTVGQVRQAPITVQNVVTYDVVVNVANPELLLKPGMTANVTIVTAKRDDVLRVPEQALQFSPSGLQADPAPDSGIEHQARVWVANGDKLAAVKVTPGLDDGTNVELLNAPLQVGQKVAIGEIAAAASANSPPHFPR
ncbi:MAG: efflux RND transporter periplasmic adaptor subunit [Candidatus Binataceae bacterium]